MLQSCIFCALHDTVREWALMVQSCIFCAPHDTVRVGTYGTRFHCLCPPMILYDRGHLWYKVSFVVTNHDTVRKRTLMVQTTKLHFFLWPPTILYGRGHLWYKVAFFSVPTHDTLWQRALMLLYGRKYYFWMR